MLTVIGIVVTLIGGLMMVAPDAGGRRSFGASPPWWGVVWPNRTERIYDWWKRLGIVVAIVGAALLILAYLTSN